MSKAIDELMREHRLIEKVLGSLDAFAGAAERAGDASREILGSYVRFFREFADRCHHGKEEDRLLTSMVQHGLPTDEGPRVKVLTEHVAGRAYVRELAGIAAGQGPLAPAEIARLRKTVDGYVGLLRNHIQKEDQLLFPAAEKMIPTAELDQLAADFEAFERDVVGKGGHEHLHELARSLLTAYPADRSPQAAPRSGEKAGTGLRDIRRTTARIVIASALLLPAAAKAHCDTLDGPVVDAARRALNGTNVNLVLIWVKPAAEPEIRAALAKAVAAVDRPAAERQFFETLVRVHREGEGAPYTGLKEAGEVEPGIAAADEAVKSGDIDALVEHVTKAVSEGLRERFERLEATRSYDPDDVAAGREWVEAYVTFIHYVEGVHEAATGGGAHAHEETGESPEPAEHQH